MWLLGSRDRLVRHLCHGEYRTYWKSEEFKSGRNEGQRELFCSNAESEALNHFRLDLTSTLYLKPWCWPTRHHQHIVNTNGLELKRMLKTDQISIVYLYHSLSYCLKVGLVPFLNITDFIVETSETLIWAGVQLPEVDLLFMFLSWIGTRERFDCEKGHKHNTTLQAEFNI